MYHGATSKEPKISEEEINYDYVEVKQALEALENVGNDVA